MWLLCVPEVSRVGTVEARTYSSENTSAPTEAPIKESGTSIWEQSKMAAGVRSHQRAESGTEDPTKAAGPSRYQAAITLDRRDAMGVGPLENLMRSCDQSETRPMTPENPGPMSSVPNRSLADGGTYPGTSWRGESSIEAETWTKVAKFSMLILTWDQARLQMEREVTADEAPPSKVTTMVPDESDAIWRKGEVDGVEKVRMVLSPAAGGEHRMENSSAMASGKRGTSVARRAKPSKKSARLVELTGLELGTTTASTLPTASSTACPDTVS